VEHVQIQMAPHVSDLEVSDPTLAKLWQRIQLVHAGWFGRLRSF
jgi:hypothetical protein